MAETAEKAALYDEAIREYNRTVMLAFDDSQITVALHPIYCIMFVLDNDLLRDYSFYNLQDIFLSHGLNEKSLLNSELDMPLHERAYVLEYCREKGHSNFESYMYLARIYYELGEFKKATATIESALDDEDQLSQRQINSFLMLYAMFLDEGDLDPSTLREVPAEIGDFYYEDLFSAYFPWKHAHDYFINLNRSAPPPYI